MPLYEYRCGACGADEETLESISAPDHHDCPRCGVASGMKRQLSRAGFVFAGGGWYDSGYGNAETKPAAASGGKAETKVETTKAEPKTEASTESKPASGGCASGCDCH